MTTWSNLFDGYNVYTDVFGSYTTLYTQASESAGFFQLFDQMLLQSPYDLRLFFQLFYHALFPLILLFAVIKVLTSPFFKKIRTW